MANKSQRRKRQMRAKEIIRSLRKLKQRNRDIQIPTLRGDGMLMVGGQPQCPLDYSMPSA